MITDDQQIIRSLNITSAHLAAQKPSKPVATVLVDAHAVARLSNQVKVIQHPLMIGMSSETHKMATGTIGTSIEKTKTHNTETEK